MSIFFAALSALSYGAADYAGGKATRAHNVLGVIGLRVTSAVVSSLYPALAGVALAGVALMAI